MKLEFDFALIALYLCVMGAGFLYFCYVTNMYRGLMEDHLGEQIAERHHQQRNRRRRARRGSGRQKRGTDRPTSENLTATSPLRQRPRPQENDEPFWKYEFNFFLYDLNQIFYFENYILVLLPFLFFLSTIDIVCIQRRNHKFHGWEAKGQNNDQIHHFVKWRATRLAIMAYRGEPFFQS